jgi:hypothetical protein
MHGKFPNLRVELPNESVVSHPIREDDKTPSFRLLTGEGWPGVCQSDAVSNKEILLQRFFLP